MTAHPRWTAWALRTAMAVSGTACGAEHSPITIRTEAYPRLPYSEATYYVYERDGKTICTKLAVCNKFEHCETSYHPGTFKDAPDVKNGKPYDITSAAEIPEAKWRKHQCLAKFVLDAK